jgi:hypothetical protein
MRSPRIEDAERSLVALLEVLASVLIQLDITPARVDELMRTSFVKAGASSARKKHSTRPHIARLAAITGLTRTEVKRIVQENYSIHAAGIETAPRTLRVIAGWKSVGKYSSKGLPKPLKLGGAAPSFESLCKEFSGDIPHTAVLTELVSRGRVRIATRRGEAVVVVVRSTSARSGGHADKLKFISSVARALAKEDRVLVKAQQFVPTSKEISAAYFEKSVASRISTMITALPIGRRRNTRKVKRKGGLDVFAIVARRE